MTVQEAFELLRKKLCERAVVLSSVVVCAPKGLTRSVKAAIEEAVGQ